MSGPVEAALGQLVEEYCGLDPSGAAGVIEGQSFEETVRLLGRLSGVRAAAVLERLTPSRAARALERLDDRAAAEVMEKAEPARVAALLHRFDEETRARLLALVPAAHATELRALFSYPDASAGALMDPRVTTFREETTVGQAVERIRQLGRRRIHDIFLVDDEGRLAGAVPLQEVVSGAETERLADFARGAPISVGALAGREEVVETLDRHRLASLPVVDHAGRLVGVIRHDALVRVAEQEISADMQSMVGASREERALSSVSFAVRKRLPWLQINLATAFLAASVVGLFEATIAQFTALAVLLPVVAGQSGNTGAQSLAVTMRGLTLREIRMRHWPRVTFKEVTVGTINGVAVAAVTSLGVFIWSRSAGLCLVIGLAMVLSMAIAGIAGALIPVLLTGLGQDPAQSSSIILTTITDVAGFFSFLGLATLFTRLL